MSTTGDNDSIAMLMSMGFDESEALQALSVCGGNVEHAVNHLLSGATASSSSTAVQDTTSGTNTRMVQGAISQYSIPDGRSACTSIALTAAAAFLESDNPPASVDPDFLQRIVLGGNDSHQAKNRTGSVEHKSAEEILQNGGFPSLSLHGPIRQGILSRDPNSLQGLKQSLLGCRPAAGWACVLITKSPETVLVALPSSDSESFILIDSHPRPQFGAEQAYARFHASLGDLVQSLEMIFPPTDLGPDVPELMAAMYNSFDLYTFEKKR